MPGAHPDTVRLSVPPRGGRAGGPNRLDALGRRLPRVAGGGLRAGGGARLVAGDRGAVGQIVWLSGLAASTARYDAIFLDAYRQPYIPFYLVTREFFASVRSHLRRGGLLIINIGHVPGSDALEKVVSATLRAVFPDVARDRVNKTNSLVLASTRPISAGRLVSAIGGGILPADLYRVAATAVGDLGAALPGGAVYTDDRAPVEWLTDISILRYAAGSR